ncbi:MAG: hypothetical protein IKI95_00085 [Clostridia bacterium]|nr:hypothetical protein [Clostridia bacterium]
MGLLKKLFSIPEKFGRIFTFYNKHGIVSRIIMLLVGVGFTVGTLFLEKWAFGLFADNYLWGLLALILSFGIGLGCAEFLIMCCVTAVLSTLKSSVVDTAKFISKKSKDKKEKSGSKDKGSTEELNSEGLASLRAAEQKESKSSKDAGFGFKDAINKNEWETITKALQKVGKVNNLENFSIVDATMEIAAESQESEEIKLTAETPVSQNLSTQNKPVVEANVTGEQIVENKPNVENMAQNEPKNVGLSANNGENVANTVQTSIETQNQPQPKETIIPTQVKAVAEQTNSITVQTETAQPQQVENVQTAVEEVKVEEVNTPINQTEVLKESTQPVQPQTVEAKVETSETEPVQTLQTENVEETLQTEEQPSEEQTNLTASNEEEPKNEVEDDSKKLEGMLQNENGNANELEGKKKRSYKIFDIFSALIFGALGFVVVTKYIAIFKENANELKFWEKINFSKIWEWIKFWD